MVEYKTIGIVTLLTLLSGTGSYLYFSNIDTNIDNYYCESHPEYGPQQCTPDGIICGELNCDEGWTLIVPECVQYRCDNTQCLCVK
jgi:hypothetical protein